MNKKQHNRPVTSFYRLNAALKYARRGWRVVPVNNKKIPLVKRWPEISTTDLEQVKRWWTDFPYANIGIVTGSESGIWVLDIDIKNNVNGIESLKEKFGDIGLDDNQLIAQSPTGGFHLYFEWDDTLPVTVAANVLSGIDIRGETGFIVAAPSSINVEGKNRCYKFNNDKFKIPPAPPWAREIAEMSLLSKTSKGKNNVKQSKFDVASVMEGVSEGSRDDSLFRYVHHLKSCGVDYELARGFILEAAARCNPVFDQHIALEKVDRAYSSQPKNRDIFSLKSGE